MLTFRHIQILFLLALSQDELTEYIKPKNKFTLYSGSYNGAGLTYRVEIIFLRLYIAIFASRGSDKDIDVEIDEETGVLLKELNFINSDFLIHAELGSISCMDLTYNPSAGEIFWSINRRYAKIILNRLNINLQKPVFDFCKTLAYFKFDTITLTEEDFMSYLHSA